MLRESLDPGARMMSVGTNMVDRVERKVRVLPNYPAWPQQVYSLDKIWMRIDRIGFLFRAYIAEDNGGQPGTWIPYLNQYLMMPDCILIGIYAEGEDNTAQYTNVTVTPAGTPALAIQNDMTATETSTQERTAIRPNGKAEVQLFPNPSSGLVNLNLLGFADQEVEVRIVTTDGKIVRHLELGRIDAHTEQMDLSGLRAGMYMVQITGSEQAPILRRVVLQPRP